MKSFFFPLINTYVAPKSRKQQESLCSAEACECTLGSQQEPKQTRPGRTQAWASLSPSSPRACTRLPEPLQELWSTSLPKELGKHLFRWVVFKIRIPTTCSHRLPQPFIFQSHHPGNSLPSLHPSAPASVCTRGCCSSRSNTMIPPTPSNFIRGFHSTILCPLPAWYPDASPLPSPHAAQSTPEPGNVWAK